MGVLRLAAPDSSPLISAALLNPMRPWMLVLIAVVLGLVMGLGLTMLELGASPAGAVLSNLSLAQRPRTDSHGPRVEVDKDTFEFGTMGRDTSMSHTFTLRNAGTEPLVLKKGESSCRCTHFDVVKTTLAPGESTAVEVQWKADVNQGPFRQTASIETNDSGRPLVTLTINGKVILSHRVSPPDLVFSNVSTSDTQTADLHVFAYQQKDLQVLGHEFTDPTTADKFEVRVDPMSADLLHTDAEAASGQVVHVTVKPGLPMGPIRQKIRLRLNLPDKPVTEVGFEGNVIGDVQIVGHGWDGDRGLIDFGTVRSREGAKANLYIQARGAHRQELRPTVHEVESDSLKVSLGEPTALAGGNLVRVPLTVEIPVGAKPAVHLGNQQGKLASITIDTGHPEGGTLRILVRFAVSD